MTTIVETPKEICRKFSIKYNIQGGTPIKIYSANLEELVKEKTREIALIQEITIESLATLAEYRDPETGGHIKRTQYYVKALAEKLKDHNTYKDILNISNIDLLYISTPLHDIGKVGVRDSILLKPGKLTKDEFEEMKKHATLGHDALKSAETKLGVKSFLLFAKTIALTHHEKWDGSGYPQGLNGENIPVVGRLMALADVYDALMSKRVYKQPFPHTKAVKIIEDRKGKHFDPEMVDAFLEIQNKFKEIAMVFADFDEEREMINR